MTPAEITALTGLIALLRDVMTLKGAGLMAVIVFGPEMALFVIVLFIVARVERMSGENRRVLEEYRKTSADIIGEQRKQFDAVVRQYENNAELVKNVTQLAEDLRDIVVLNTQQMQSVHDLVKNNLYCPLMRKGMEMKP